MKKFFNNKVILITGASSGIGKALAHESAKNGAHVILLARRFELISSIANELTSNYQKCIAVKCDVTKDGDLENAVVEGIKHFGKINIAIANAGFGVRGKLEDLKLEDYRRQFETNVFGVLRTIYAALPELKKSKGTICVMGSVAGYVPFPSGDSPYVMSKFAIRGLIEPLDIELEAHDVSVTHIMPGFVNTEFNNANFTKKIHWLVIQPEKAARLILKAIQKRKREVVLTRHGKILMFLQRYVPFVLRWATKKFTKIRK